MNLNKVQYKGATMLQNYENNNMYDLGEEDEFGPVAVRSKDSDEPEIYYPSVHLNTKQLPPLKNVSVGDKLKLIVEVEVKGADVREEDTSYRLEMKSAMCKPMNKQPLMKHEKMVDEDEIPMKKDSSPMEEFMED